jgi:iron complex transport system substrate-binding protein
MRQPAAALILAIALLLPACRHRASSGPATRPGAVTVASLVPAATDLILGMNARDHLVAISNWDADRPEIAALARVGDYRTIDWEKLAVLRPNLMIVQFAPDKTPPGLAERAADLNINLLNIKINRLGDIFDAFHTIGRAINESDKAARAAVDLSVELDKVHQRIAGRPPVRTLILHSESALAAVGPGTFLDDLLTICGGKNVLADATMPYPTLDREKLLALNPDVVLQLLPGASPQIQAQARDFWSSVPSLAAVRAGRVHILTEPYLLLPGYSVARVAEQFAKLLHPTA